MIKTVFSSALFAGLGGGVVATLLQLGFVVPVLMEGELYETGARRHFDGTSIQSEAGIEMSLADAGRHLATGGFNLIAFTGFALLLVLGFVAASRLGEVRIDARRGAVWGLCGFLAVNLAPAAGLPPELPGTIAAELAARQTWWALCVVATIAGIATFAFARGPLAIVGGAALVLLPHLIGAPGIDTHYGLAPPELAAHFATRSLAVAALSWATVGLIAGWVWQRGDPA